MINQMVMLNHLVILNKVKDLRLPIAYSIDRSFAMLRMTHTITLNQEQGIRRISMFTGYAKPSLIRINRKSSSVFIFSDRKP